MVLLLSGIGVEVVSVSLVLKESQSDAVELKPWMTTSDLYCRLTVKFIHMGYEPCKQSRICNSCNDDVIVCMYC